MERWDEGFGRWINILTFGVVLVFLFMVIAYFNDVTSFAMAVELTREKYASIIGITHEEINLSITIFIGFTFVITFLSRFWLDFCERSSGFWSDFIGFTTGSLLMMGFIPLSYWLAFTVFYTDINYFLIMLLLLLIYFIPPIMAEKRRHHNKMAISLLSLLLGWTIIGWFIALIWSTTSTIPTKME